MFGQYWLIFVNIGQYRPRWALALTQETLFFILFLFCCTPPLRSTRSTQVVLKEHGNHEGGKSAINHQHLEYVASSPTQPSSRVRCDVVLTTGMYVVVPVVFNADTHNAMATPRHGSHGTVMVDSIVLCFYGEFFLSFNMFSHLKLI